MGIINILLLFITFLVLPKFSFATDALPNHSPQRGLDFIPSFYPFSPIYLHCWINHVLINDFYQEASNNEHYSCGPIAFYANGTILWNHHLVKYLGANNSDCSVFMDLDIPEPTLKYAYNIINATLDQNHHLKTMVYEKWTPPASWSLPYHARCHLVH